MGNREINKLREFLQKGVEASYCDDSRSFIKLSDEWGEYIFDAEEVFHFLDSLIPYSTIDINQVTYTKPDDIDCVWGYLKTEKDVIDEYCLDDFLEFNKVSNAVIVKILKDRLNALQK